jgi:hypothetical protein
MRAYQARPERLRERIAAEEPGLTTVVIDEVQKTPQLLDVVHSLVEERPELRFVLAGSSARKLRHGAANLLGGRLVAAHMPPFMAAELGEGFSLERAQQIGDFSRFLEVNQLLAGQPAEPGQPGPGGRDPTQTGRELSGHPGGSAAGLRLPPAGVSTPGSAATGAAPEVLLL